MISPVSRSLKMILLGVAAAAISFIASKHQRFQGLQKIAAVHQNTSKNSSVQPKVAPTTALASVHLRSPLNKPSDEELPQFCGSIVV